MARTAAVYTAPVRAFVAIPVPRRVAEAALDAAQRAAGTVRSIRWVALENIHLTLKFLGEISDEQAAGISAGLEAIAREATRDKGQVRGLGAFPPGGPVRIIWAGVAGAPTLTDLARRVEDAAERIGVAREDRPFAPHVTIGRKKDPRGSEQLRAGLAACVKDFGPLPVEEIVLMRSELHAEGAKYEIVAKYGMRA